MARNPSGLPSVAQGPWSKPSDSRSPEELRASDRYRYCPWPRLLGPEEIRAFNLTQDDADTLEGVGEALFRSDIPDEKAAELFDRVFVWCAENARWRTAS